MPLLNELPWIQLAITLVVVKGIDYFVSFRASKRNSSASSKPQEDDEPETSATDKDMITQGKNYVEGGVDDNPAFLLLIIIGPMLCNLLGYLTSKEMVMEPYLSTLVPACFADLEACGVATLDAAWLLPSLEGFKFLAAFMGVALVLEFLPGKIQTGPETLTGHVPHYVDNGVKFCLVFTALFFAGSNLGYGNWYDFGCMYDIFPSMLITLNVFGIVFCSFLTFKGLTFPSTADSGTTGSIFRDFIWGTELYPRVMGLDLKRFINCRFSMMYWMLAGLSFAYRSYTIHGAWDYGLVFSAISQYLYLFKFFWCAATFFLTP